MESAEQTAAASNESRRGRATAARPARAPGTTAGAGPGPCRSSARGGGPGATPTPRRRCGDPPGGRRTPGEVPGHGSTRRARPPGARPTSGREQGRGEPPQVAPESGEAPTAIGTGHRDRLPTTVTARDGRHAAAEVVTRFDDCGRGDHEHVDRRGATGEARGTAMPRRVTVRGRVEGADNLPQVVGLPQAVVDRSSDGSEVSRGLHAGVGRRYLDAGDGDGPRCTIGRA